MQKPSRPRSTNSVRARRSCSATPLPATMTTVYPACPAASSKPPATWPWTGSDRSESSRPSARVVRARRLLAAALGTYSSASAASRTVSRVGSLMRRSPDSAREAVARDTPARAATSANVVRRGGRVSLIATAGRSSGPSPDARHVRAPTPSSVRHPRTRPPCAAFSSWQSRPSLSRVRGTSRPPGMVRPALAQGPAPPPQPMQPIARR